MEAYVFRIPNKSVHPSSHQTDDVPNVRFMELWFKLLADRRFDVKHCEGTSNVEEQRSDGKPPSWTYPVKSPSRTEIPETGRVKRVRMARIVPSARSENPILGILHGPIQLPVLQEPFRIILVWLRVHGLVVAYSPTQRSKSMVTTAVTPKRSPDVLNDRCACRDEVSLICIIFRSTLWNPERDGTSPPEQLFNQCGDVGQVVHI